MKAIHEMYISIIAHVRDVRDVIVKNARPPLQGGGHCDCRPEGAVLFQRHINTINQSLRSKVLNPVCPPRRGGRRPVSRPEGAVLFHRPDRPEGAVQAIISIALLIVIKRASIEKY